MVVPVVTEATLAQAMPITAKIWKITLAMELAAMTAALMWPSTAVWAACATPHRKPLSTSGEDTLTKSFRKVKSNRSSSRSFRCSFLSMNST